MSLLIVLKTFVARLVGRGRRLLFVLGTGIRIQRSGQEFVFDLNLIPRNKAVFCVAFISIENIQTKDRREYFL